MRPLLLLTTSVLLLGGCFPARYLAQAAAGQADLLLSARPIHSVLSDAQTDPRTRRLLGEVRAIKSFARTQGIKPTNSYGSYVRMSRPAVSYVVSASAPLRFEAHHWTFPVVGSVPYLGWFSRRDALRYADEMREDGWDVDVRPVEAYSTLGYFSDPVLSCMLPDGDEAMGELVNVILHESVHATVYVNGQGYFNESLASFVADGLTPSYLQARFGPESAEYLRYQEMTARSRERAARLHAAYYALEAVYRSTEPDDVKRTHKERILEETRAALGWKRPLNNATLMQFRTYAAGAAGFEAVLRACDGRMDRFLKAMGQLPEQAFGVPQQEELGSLLMLVAHQGCRV